MYSGSIEVMILHTILESCTFYVPDQRFLTETTIHRNSYWQWVIIVVLILTLGLVASFFLSFFLFPIFKIRPGTKILSTTIENLPGVNSTFVLKTNHDCYFPAIFCSWKKSGWDFGCVCRPVRKSYLWVQLVLFVISKNIR